MQNKRDKGTLLPDEAIAKKLSTGLLKKIATG
jgi:hypothetical protein